MHLIFVALYFYAIRRLYQDAGHQSMAVLVCIASVWTTPLCGLSPSFGILGNLISSLYITSTGGMLVDWIDPAKVEGNGTIVDVRVARMRLGE